MIRMGKIRRFATSIIGIMKHTERNVIFAYIISVAALVLAIIALIVRLLK